MPADDLSAPGPLRPTDDGGGPVGPDPLAALLAPRQGWRTRLDDLTGGVAFWPRGRTATAGLIGLAGAIAGALLVGLILRAPAAGSPAPVVSLAHPTGRTGTAAPVSASPTSPDPAGPPVGTAAPTLPPPAGIWVAAAGAVARPGLYLLRADARVSELVEVAGGLGPDADADRVNLAARLHDGDRVYVLRRGEPTPPSVVRADGDGGAHVGSPGGSDGAAGSAGAAPGDGGPGPTPASREHPVNLNTAGAVELETLPGVGPATAAAIVDDRTAHGPFASVDELTRVRGIGPAKLEQVRALVVV